MKIGLQTLVEQGLEWDKYIGWGSKMNLDITFWNDARDWKAEIQEAGPNLDLLCVWHSDAALFCENYAKLYFDIKHLEKGLNRGWWNFLCTFFRRKCPFWQISDPALIF